MKKQKEKIDKELGDKVNERKKKEGEMVEMEKKENKQKSKIKQQMSQVYKDQKDAIKNIEIDINQLQPQEQKWEVSLKTLFKYFVGKDNKKIDGNLEGNLNSLSFNSFVKLGYQAKITPKLVSTDEHIKIFRQLVRGNESQSIGYDQYLKALAKIHYQYLEKQVVGATPKKTPSKATPIKQEEVTPTK